MPSCPGRSKSSIARSKNKLKGQNPDLYLPELFAMKHSYLVAALALCSLAAGCGGGDVVSDSVMPVAGNWTDCRTGEWRYGFYDGMAIADGDFWSYESVAVTASRAEIVLHRDGESKRVVLLRDNAADSLCRERRGLFSRRPLVRSAGYVAAISADNRAMGNPSLVLDSVTVRGYLPGVEDGANVTLSISNIIHNDNTFGSVMSSVDSCGRFETRLPCVCLSELIVECGNVYGHIYCAPGDVVMVTRDTVSGRTLVMGEYARLYNEEEAYRRYVEEKNDYVDIDYYDTIPHEAYFDRVRSEVEAGGRRRLDGFVAASGPLSRRFMESNMASQLYSMINYAAYRRFALRGDGRDRLPECYASYLDSVVAALPPQFRMLWTDPDVYFNTRTGGTRGSKSYWVVAETLRYMDEHGIRSLSETERGYIETWNEGMDALRSGAITAETLPDSFRAANDSLMALWSGDEMQAFVKEKGEKFIGEIVDVRMAILDPLEKIAESGVDNRFEELCAANLFMEDIYYRQHSMGELWFSEMEKRISDPVLRRCIEAENEKYLAIENTGFDCPASIMPSEPYAAETDAGELWNRIAERYRGKVVAIDFWGTWCVPCREEMPAVKVLAARYDGRDVVFVFFAYMSPEESWLNVIRELGMTAPNIVHFNLPDKQMQLLVDKFGVTSYPTHILVDREGNVLPEDVPGLWVDDKALPEAIDRLLD